MAVVLTDSEIYVHDQDLTGVTSQGVVDVSVKDLDTTTFGSGGWEESTAGLRSVKIKLSGLWAAGPDALTVAALADTTGLVHTIAPDGDEQAAAWMLTGSVGSAVAVGGKVGDLAGYDLGVTGTGLYQVRGQLAATSTVVAATGQLGSVVDLVAGPGATEYVYATVHCLARGTTVTVALESDDNSGMTSAVSRATLTITATGGYWLTRVAGPLAGERYWRLNVTAITGSHTLAAAIGKAS